MGIGLVLSLVVQHADTFVGGLHLKEIFHDFVYLEFTLPRLQLAFGNSERNLLLMHWPEVYSSRMGPPNCSICGSQMHQRFSLSSARGAGMSWECPTRHLHFSVKTGSPLDFGRSEKYAKRTRRRIRKADMRQKMRQQPLRFFVVEPLKAIGGVLLGGLLATGGLLFDLLIKIVVVAIGFGLVFLLFKVFTANIVISVVVVGVVAAILLLLAMLYW
jgi:hypothetical protein